MSASDAQSTRAVGSDPMARFAVVLVEPQNPLNVGSVVRACRNCGITDLRVVRPVSMNLDRITITAPHSAEWVDAHVTEVETWAEACEGLHEVVAFTARGREERTPRERLDASIGRWSSQTDGRVGLIFGREDHGLPNDIVDRCDAWVTLETHEGYTSLNLAQAVMIACHRVFVALGDAAPMRPAGRSFDKADRAKLERMMDTVEEALHAINFFNGDQRDNVLRTLQRVFVRAELDEQELATWWGVFAGTAKLGRAALTGSQSDE